MPVTARLTPEAVLDLRLNSDVVLSADGARLAWRSVRAPRAGEPQRFGIGGLWSMAVRSGVMQPVTGAGTDATHPRWSPDGMEIAWIEPAPDTEVPQVFVKSIASDAPRVATAAGGGIVAFEWSPNGRHIAFTAWDEETAEQRQAREEGRDWRVFGEAERQLRLYVMDASGARARAITPAAMSVHGFAWAPDSLRLAFAAAPSPSADDELLRVEPYLVDTAGGQPILLAKHFGRLAYPSWSDDGKWIAWLASEGVADAFHGSVFVVPADRRTPPRNLSPGAPRTATWLGRWTGDPGAFAMLAVEGQVTRLYAVDAASGKHRLLYAPAHILSGTPSFSADGKVIASTGNHPTHPDEIFVRHAGTAAQGQRLTHSNPGLDAVTLGQQDVTRWKSKDGMDVEGVMIKPVGFRPGVRYPVVVHVHGGSESVILDGWRGSYNDWGQQLAARGYVVIYPNYRGSIGRGAAYVSGNRGDLMGGEWEDIESALDHVIELGIADRARAGIYGFSWGGYAAGWGATYASHRFKAAVGGAGIYNWISEAGSNDTRMHEQLSHWGVPLYQAFDLYLQRSPIHQIHNASTPLLMLHGEEDASCPPGQAIEMHTAMTWKQVPVELVLYPREGHGMRERPHQDDFLRRGIGWFDRHLGPAQSGRE